MGWSNDIPNPFTVGGGGVSGEIILYNSADQIIGVLNEDGIIVLDPSSGTYVFITPDPVAGAKIDFGPPSEAGHVFTAAPLFTRNFGAPDFQPFVSMISPSVDGGASSQWALIGESASDNDSFAVFATEAQFQADITTVDIPNGTAVTSLWRGIRSSLGSNANSAAVASETVVATLAGFVWRAGRAYKIEMGQRVESSVAQQRARFLIRRGTTIAGSLVGDFGTTLTSDAAADENCYGCVFLVNATGSDVTQDICITLDNESSAVNTVTWLGSATSPRWLVISDAGASGDYSFATQI